MNDKTPVTDSVIYTSVQAGILDTEFTIDKIQQWIGRLEQQLEAVVKTAEFHETCHKEAYSGDHAFKSAIGQQDNVDYPYA